MQKKPNEAVIMLCKCGHSHKAYGLRTEKLAKNHWRVTWAFAIRESAAKNEGYDKTAVKGNIEFTNEYPGCPYCGSNEMTLCTSCGHLTCTHPVSGVQTCEWCGSQGVLATSVAIWPLLLVWIIDQAKNFGVHQASYYGEIICCCNVALKHGSIAF